MDAVPMLPALAAHFLYLQYLVFLAAHSQSAAWLMMTYLCSESSDGSTLLKKKKLTVIVHKSLVLVGGCHREQK